MSSGQARLNTFARPAPVKYLLLLHTNRQEGNGTRAEQWLRCLSSPTLPALLISRSWEVSGSAGPGQSGAQKINISSRLIKTGRCFSVAKFSAFFPSYPDWSQPTCYLCFLPCVATTLRSGGQASDQCRIYRSLSCQSWPEVGRLLILCHAGPHSGDASQQSGCSIMSSLPSIPVPGLLGETSSHGCPHCGYSTTLQDRIFISIIASECLANILRQKDALIVDKLATINDKRNIRKYFCLSLTSH